jgi:hypothetical protein
MGRDIHVDLPWLIERQAKTQEGRTCGVRPSRKLS